MKKNLTGSLLLTFITLFIICSTPPGVGAADTPDTGTITDIKVDDNSIIVKGDRSFTYTLYSANDPYKVTLDIPDMKAGAFSDRIPSDKKGITEIIPHETASPTPSVKLEIVLQNPSSVIPVYNDGLLTLQIKPEEPVLLTGAAEKKTDEVKPASEGGSTEKAQAAIHQTKATEDERPQAHATEISKIELRKSFEAVKVSISGNGSMKPNVFPLDNRIVIDIPGVAMKASVPSRYVTPLKGMRVGKYREKVRIVLDLKEKTAFDVAAQGSTVEIALRNGKTAAKSDADNAGEPVREAAAVKTSLEDTTAQSLPAQDDNSKDLTPIAKGKVLDDPAQYQGRKISLDFQDVEVGQLIRLLADMRQPEPYNLVLDPSVKGKRIPNLKLMSIPWDQALEIICKSSGLGYRLDGNVLWIAPINTFSKMEEEKKKARESEEQSGELLQEVIRVNYATSAEIQTAINQGKLLSPRGSITVDGRMNTLIIKDTEKSIGKIRDLVKIMDVTKPQVMIEAKLVQVSNKYTENLGIQWGGSFFAPAYPGVANGQFSVNTPTSTAGPSAKVPGGMLSMLVGNANTFKVNLSLSALETINKAKTLANPKILTMDNESATIQQGTTFFIPTVSQAGTQSQAQNATLSLQVTPKITPDGYVQVKVVATNNSLEQGTAGASAVVDTQSLTTQALVKNGETLVLGGIYQKSSTEVETGLPGISKIPILGWLFKTRQTTGPDVTELLIFITPTIINQAI